jgi:hypothetical protein
LLSRPFRSRMIRRVEVNNFSSSVMQNDKYVHDPKCCRWNGEEIDRDKIGCMVCQEGFPDLRGRLLVTNDVLCYSRFGYLDAKHFQFAMDSRRALAGAPQPMLFRDIVRISCRTSGSIAGRPPWRGRDFHVQYNRNPLRCHRTNVSGLKILSVCKHEGHRR